MSSTSAVAVLAQGLRDLRDYAEGPEGEDLRERTGLSAQQIDAALAGEQLPSREVTLALVAAWEGDVEAWRAYWAQIAELAESEAGGESGGGKKKGTPTPPEPSIITPMRAEGAAEADTESAAAGVQADAAAEDKADEDTAAIPATDGAGEAAALSEEAGTAAIPQAAHGEEMAGASGAAGTPQAATGGIAPPAASEHAVAAGGAMPADTAASKPARTESVGAGQGAAEPAPGEAGHPQPASGPAGGAGAASATEPALPRSESDPARKPTATAVTATPRKKNTSARLGIPAVLFAVGVGVGAFGDHALNSKSSSNPQPASLPNATHSLSTTSPSQPPSSSSSSSSSSQTTTPTATTGSSTSPSASESSSSSSTASPGAPLGAYSNIQLASGYSVDFFNDTYHPVPGTSNGPDTMGFFASSFVDGRFYADRVAILDPQDTGSFTTCRNNTRYQHDVLLSQVSAGTSFCVHTATGHLVLVTVRRMPSSTDANSYAVLDLTVWQDS